MKKSIFFLLVISLISLSLSISVFPQAAFAETISLIGTIRDFCNPSIEDICVAHPDFEGFVGGLQRGQISNILGEDKKPVYVLPDKPGFNGKSNFEMWYNDEPGVNLSDEHQIILDNSLTADPRVFTFLSNSFFPIDGKLFGNQNRNHNYHFTYEIHSSFVYNGGETFLFSGDDDLWVFIDDKLVIDLGGVHPPRWASVHLDNLDLIVGETYDFDLFFAERHTSNSNFRIDTSIALIQQEEDQDTDGDEITDQDDNCPFIPNPNQDDTDENGIGDACQDVDGDTVTDQDDNCPFIPNPNQDDTDENGIGDACQDATELLVEATFTAGQKISAQLPPNPVSGTFSLSIRLPDTGGGKVTIRTTDAGDTPGNFAFLGNVIDFTAPCSDTCEISFTFTQAALDAQGITIDQVTIFHDSNHDGSFEESEAIETTITGSDPFTATGNAQFTSKFSIGSIKALALGALAAGGGSNGGNPPALQSIAFDGTNVNNDDGTLEFGGLIIDKITSENNLPMQTISTGIPFELRLPFYEDSGVHAIEHVAIYFLNQGEKIYDSKTYIVYDKYKPLSISDPNNYFSKADVSVIEKNAYDIDVIFGITFDIPMPESDIIVRTWDKHKRSADYKFNKLLYVIASEKPKISESNDDYLSETTTEYETSKSLMTNGKESFEIPIWIKNNAIWWSNGEIDEKDFVAGVQYLIEKDIMSIPKTESSFASKSDIPEWIKNSAGWWAEGLTSDKEFVNAIQWLITHGIVKV